MGRYKYDQRIKNWDEDNNLDYKIFWRKLGLIEMWGEWRGDWGLFKWGEVSRK